jgi:hypothetical protein
MLCSIFGCWTRQERDALRAKIGAEAPLSRYLLGGGVVAPHRKPKHGSAGGASTLPGIRLKSRSSALNPWTPTRSASRSSGNLADNLSFRKPEAHSGRA